MSSEPRLLDWGGVKLLLLGWAIGLISAGVFAGVVALVAVLLP